MIVISEFREEKDPRMAAKVFSDEQEEISF